MQLDNLHFIKSIDSNDALGVIGDSANQLKFDPVINQPAQHYSRPTSIVLSGMGGSCLAGLIVKNWLDHQYSLSVPMEISRDYQIPAYANANTLVICFSVSGNTEETVSSLHDALAKGCQVAVITSGGKLLDEAQDKGLPYIQLDKISQPRYGVPMHLKAIINLLADYQLIDDQPMNELNNAVHVVADLTRQLAPTVSYEQNIAKKLAWESVGKTALVYSSRLFYPLAYKWKTSFNESSKNTLWCNEFPEFNHNEFIGWTSHPIEKPFCVYTLRSNLDNPRINQRLDLTEQLLSGHRPSTHDVILPGNNLIEQFICGAVLGDFISIYLGILNGVNPTPVDLVERFKVELGKI